MKKGGAPPGAPPSGPLVLLVDGSPGGPADAWPPFIFGIKTPAIAMPAGKSTKVANYLGHRMRVTNNDSRVIIGTVACAAARPVNPGPRPRAAHRPSRSVVHAGRVQARLWPLTST
jgi:hypothetical protein